MKINKNFILTLGAIAMSSALSGCLAMPSPQSKLLKEADSSMVANCKFVGVVGGGEEHRSQEKAIEYGKVAALNKAAALKATHYVSKDPSCTSSSMGAKCYSSVSAYICP